jgi:hypothetical protein
MPKTRAYVNKIRPFAVLLALFFSSGEPLNGSSDAYLLHIILDASVSCVNIDFFGFYFIA